MIKFLFAAALAVAASDEAPKSLTPAEQAQLQENLNRGLDLYRYDQAAWHLTDAMLAALPDTSKQLIRGYITTPASKGLRTTFFGEAPGSYYSLYSAVWTGTSVEDPVIHSPAERRPVSDEERRLILARKVALEGAGTLDMCSSAPANAIVVPGADSLVHVYVLTPQTQNHSYPLGGHHRIDVKDGSVVAKRTFTKSCINFDTAGRPDKGSPEAAVITHLLDSVPTELHVFSVFAMRVPLYVAVRDKRIYAVEISSGQPRVRLVSQ